MDIYKIFKESIDKWSEKECDSRIEEAFDNFEDWIKNYDEEEKQILSELLRRFNYYSMINVVDIVKEFCNSTIKKFGISNQNSVVSIVRKADGTYNSSYDYWMHHQSLSGLSKKIYYDSLDNIDDESWENISNIVFIDDCSGTGRQFIKFLKHQKKDFSGKKIYFYVIVIMKEALDFINDYGCKKGIDIQIIYHTLEEKVLKTMEDNVKTKFLDMSIKQEIPYEYITGFKNAEALMAFYNNTPNDTLGLFWFSSSKNTPIFIREEVEEPGWKKIKKNKKERSRQRYETKVR